MPSSSTGKAAVKALIKQLRADFPQVKYRAGSRFYWSPATQEVFYPRNADDITAVFSLLHETGHALLSHKRYSLDFELLELEVAAWQRARQLAIDYSIDLSEDHIEDCLDTYRDWLYRRSICPSCTSHALQVDNQPRYHCHNCQTDWQVSPSRFCRPYRKLHSSTAQAVFATMATA